MPSPPTGGRALALGAATVHGRAMAVVRPLRIPLLVLVFALSATAYAQLDEDRRSARPAAPETVEALAARFAPGFEALSAPGTITLAEGERYTFSAAVESGACYAVAAVGIGPTDVDVRVRRAGATIAQDARLDGYPIATWCPTSRGTERITIRAFEGSGEVAYLLLIDPDTRAAAVGDRDELSNRLDAHIARAAPRFAASGPQWRSSFDAPGEQEMAVDVRAGVCVAVAVVGQTTVEDIDLLLEDAAGRELGRDFALDATPVVSYCGERDETLTLRVAVRAGRGVVAAQALEAIP